MLKDVKDIVGSEHDLLRESMFIVGGVLFLVAIDRCGAALSSFQIEPKSLLNDLNIAAFGSWTNTFVLAVIAYAVGRVLLTLGLLAISFWQNISNGVLGINKIWKFLRFPKQIPGIARGAPVGIPTPVEVMSKAEKDPSIRSLYRRHDFAYQFSAMLFSASWILVILTPYKTGFAACALFFAYSLMASLHSRMQFFCEVAAVDNEPKVKA